MMDRDKFQAQIVRLSARWKNAHPAEFVNLLWREVKDLSDEWLVRAVDDLIGSCRQAPLMPDFRERAQIEKDRQWQKKKHEPLRVDWSKYLHCDCCRDTGTFICAQNTTGDLYAFRCHCAKGLQDPRTVIPPFRTEHAKEFSYCDIAKYGAGLRAVGMPE